MISIAFLKEALPTLRAYCEYFGLRYSEKNGFTVRDRRLYEQWEKCTGAMPDEFWLLNSYLIHLRLKERSVRPISDLKAKHLNDTLPINDNVIVAEIHEFRDDIIRSVVFTDMQGLKRIPVLDKRENIMMRYFARLGIVRNGHITVSLHHVLTFCVRRKRTHSSSHEML